MSYNSLGELLSSIGSIFKQTPNCSSLAAHVDYLLSYDSFQFDNWYEQQFSKTFQSIQQKSQNKSLEDSERYKQCSDVFKSMTDDEQIASKALTSINKAIIYSPSDATQFLSDCFIQRSNIHYQLEDFESALLDIDNSLTLINVPSLQVIDRKITILKKLKRSTEAYKFVCDLLTLKSCKGDRKLEQLRKWKKQLKQNRRIDQFAYLKHVERDSKERHYIEIDSRITMVRNMYNQRIGFRATGSIPNETNILVEEPTIFFASTLSFCTQCMKECSNTFWPCSYCTEVIFCSKKCEERSQKVDGIHRNECGMINAIYNELSPQAVLSYRLLCRIGADELIDLDHKIDHRTVSRYAAKKLFNEIVMNQPNLKRSRINELFSLTQTEMRQWFEMKSPVRSTTELSVSIILVAIYFFQKGFEKIGLEMKKISNLIRLVANEMGKVAISEYGWHRDDDQMGNFQCLIGSRFGNSCEPNVEWSFDIKSRRLILTSNRDITCGEPITISFGTTNKMSFLQRQTYLQSFHIMCSCYICTMESRENFAFRCINCNGTVPYDKIHFVNNRCMNCEHDNNIYDATNAEKIYNEFQTLNCCIRLLADGATDEQLISIERRMSRMTILIDLQNQQLINMIQDLCNEYIRRKNYKPAIEWYRWLMDGNKINLCDNKDSIVHFHNLEQWAYVFSEYIGQRYEQRTQKIYSIESMKSLTRYMVMAENIFKQMFSMFEMLNSDGRRICEQTSNVINVVDYEQVLDSLRSITQERYERFCFICEQLKSSTSYRRKSRRKSNVSKLSGKSSLGNFLN